MAAPEAVVATHPLIDETRVSRRHAVRVGDEATEVSASDNHHGLGAECDSHMGRARIIADYQRRALHYVEKLRQR